MRRRPGLSREADLVDPRIRILSDRSAESRRASLVQARRLRRRFGPNEVIDGLDLNVEPGERLAVCGPNGSGKTTLLRCIAGSLAPTSGSVSIAGHPAGTLDARRLIGASLGGERSFYMRLSGHANLRFFARLRATAPRQAEKDVRALEEELELGEIARERCDRCSSGMLQQLALARALLASPRALLLDEPTRSLDKDAVDRLWSAIDRRPAVSLIIATHSDEDIRRCTSRLTFGGEP